MGIQQLMILVLSVIIIGLFIAVGIGMFNQNLVKQNRLAVIGDLTTLAGVAVSYYKTPADMGGGDGTWHVGDLAMWAGNNYNTRGNNISNANGSYALTARGDELTIIGIGKENGNRGRENVQVRLVLVGITSEYEITIEN